MSKPVVAGTGAPSPKGMHRLTVNIPLEKVGALKNKGVLQGRSLTSLVNEGIDRVLHDPTPSPREEAMVT